MFRSRTQPLLALLLLPVLAFAGDVVFKTDGSKLRGKIVAESARDITIETPGGKMVVPRAQISRIEREGDAAKEYETRKAKLSKTDAEGWYQLGKWCLTQKGETAAKALECWNEVIRIAPDHEGARAELGHKKHDGKWLTEDEWYASKGYVKHDGRWVTPDDKDKLAAGLVFVDGKWIEPPEESEGEPEREVDPEAARKREEALARRKAAIEEAKARAAEEEKAEKAEKSSAGGGEKKSSRKGKAAKFRVLSFNVRYDFESDGNNRWQYRIDVVAKQIKQTQATLIGIQEDKADQVQDLEQRLPEFTFLGMGRNGGNSGEHNSILFKKDSWRLKENGDVWLSDTPDVPGSNTWGDKYPRKFTWALLEPVSSDKPVLFLNTHLPDGGNVEHLRLKGAGVIRDWLTKKLGDKGLSKITVIHTGDFNAPQDGEVQDVFKKDGLLRDGWDEAKPADPTPGTYGDFRGLQGNRRIDWILIGGPGRAVGAMVHDQQIDGRWPSDHYAIQMDIEIR